MTAKRPDQGASHRQSPTDQFMVPEESMKGMYLLLVFSKCVVSMKRHK